MKSKLINQLYKTILFLPLLLYFGKRSYISYDEGFYALQAKWMIKNNNWIIPVWWDQYTLDRTNGIQFLIAKSQQLFGETSFAAHLPTTIAAGLMLVFTYYLHQELISKKDGIYSTLILSTTYIWIDYAHLSNQDMIFACLITSGIYSLIKLKQKRNSIFLIFFGSWIGLAFMMKTFFVIVPLVTLFPYLLSKRESINTKFIFIGTLIGFIPFLIWFVSINSYLDKNIILYLFDKFNSLSAKNTFTNPFYYYLWNIPVNFMPWSIFSIVGIISQFRNNKKVNYLLVYFPLFFIIILSLFSTKTPYYVLPISSILSLNAYLGLREILKNEYLRFLLIKIFTQLIPSFIFITISVYLLALRKSISLNFKEEIFIITGLILSAILLIVIKHLKASKSLLLALMITPYLISTCAVQSGLLTDRSKNIREDLELIVDEENLTNSSVNVIGINSADENAISKLIKISLLTPNLGEEVKDLKDLQSSEFAWIIESKILNNHNEKFKIIASDKSFHPWKLIKKEI